MIVCVPYRAESGAIVWWCLGRVRFVVATRGEPFGIVSVEVMALGAPVLAAKTGGVPENINSPEIGRTMVEVPTLRDRGGGIAVKVQESVGYPAPLASSSGGLCINGRRHPGLGCRGAGVGRAAATSGGRPI